MRGTGIVLVCLTILQYFYGSDAYSLTFRTEDDMIGQSEIQSLKSDEVDRKLAQLFAESMRDMDHIQKQSADHGHMSEIVTGTSRLMQQTANVISNVASQLEENLGKDPTNTEEDPVELLEPVQSGGMYKIRQFVGDGTNKRGVGQCHSQSLKDLTDVSSCKSIIVGYVKSLGSGMNNALGIVADVINKILTSDIVGDDEEVKEHVLQSLQFLKEKVHFLVSDVVKEVNSDPHLLPPAKQIRSVANKKNTASEQQGCPGTLNTRRRSKVRKFTRLEPKRNTPVKKSQEGISPNVISEMQDCIRSMAGKNETQVVIKCVTIPLLKYFKLVEGVYGSGTSTNNNVKQVVYRDAGNMGWRNALLGRTIDLTPRDDPISIFGSKSAPILVPIILSDKFRIDNEMTTTSEPPNPTTTATTTTKTTTTETESPVTNTEEPEGVGLYDGPQGVDKRYRSKYDKD